MSLLIVSGVPGDGYSFEEWQNNAKIDSGSLTLAETRELMGGGLLDRFDLVDAVKFDVTVNLDNDTSRVGL